MGEEGGIAAHVNQDLLLIDGADLIEGHSTIGIETRGVENIVLKAHIFHHQGEELDSRGIGVRSVRSVRPDR